MAERSETGIDVDRLFEALHGLQKSLECTICLELMMEPMKTRCGHSFCQACIRRVLQKKTANCPLCKKSLNRRNVSKDDHLGIYVNKFKQLVIATQMDTHLDILSYLKQPRDTKESCFYSDATEFGDCNRGTSLRKLSKSIHEDPQSSSRRTDAPSMSHEAPIDCDNPRQRNSSTLNDKSEFSSLSGIHPLPIDENDDGMYDKPDFKCRVWLHTLPDDLPTNNNVWVGNDAAEPLDVTNDDERVDETRENKMDKSRARTKQARKQSANYTARSDGTSQVNKETEARQLGKVGKIDSAVKGLKYNASHARIRANAENKRKRNATKSDEQEGIQENSWESSSLRAANDQMRSDAPDRSISGTTNPPAANDCQSFADTNWSRVIEFGKEMRRKRRKVRKLDVSIERKKSAPRILENIVLSSPHKMYTLLGDFVHYSANRKERSVSNQLEEPQNGVEERRERDAIKDLSNASLNPEALERSSKNGSLANHSPTDATYIMLEEGKLVRLTNLSNDQVSHIIGVEETSHGVESQHRDENINVTPKRQNDLSLRYRLTVLTPEKLNQSLDEREINRTVVAPRTDDGVQKTSKNISRSKVQSPGKLSLKRKLIVSDRKSTDDSSALKQLPLPNDDSPTSRCEKDSSDGKSIGSSVIEDDSVLSPRLITARRDLSSQMKNRTANVSVGSSETSSKMPKNDSNGDGGDDGVPIKFMQLGTLIRRRDRNVKYFWLGVLRREQSLPAQVRVDSVYNMQQSVSRFEIEEHMMHNFIAPSFNHSHSNDITVIKNVSPAKLNRNTVASRDTEFPSAYKIPSTLTLKKNIDSQSDQKKTVIDRGRSSSSSLTNRSNKSLQRCQMFSRIHQKPCVDNDTDKSDQVLPRTTNPIKLLSPDKDSQLRFLTIDSPSEHERLADSKRRLCELDKPAIKENKFSEAKSLRSGTSTLRTREPSSESFESVFRLGSNKKRKRTNRISDEEQQFVKEASEKNNSIHSDDDTLEYVNGSLKNATSAASKKHRTLDDQEDELIILDSNEQDTHMKKYKRILSIPTSDTESDSLTHNLGNEKRRNTDDQRVQQKASTTPKEIYLVGHDTDEDLRIQSIVSKWSNEHNNVTQKKLIKESKNSSPGYCSEGKPASRLSRSSNSFEIEKHSNANPKMSQSNLFESNSIFCVENVDRIMQQMIKADRSQSSQRIANPSNEDIINRVLQIDRAALTNSGASQRNKTSGEHLLHDNLDEIIANVELPQSEDVMSQAEQSSRNLDRTLTQRKTSNRFAVANKSRDVARESPITISSTADMFERAGFSGTSTLRLGNIVPERYDKANVASHDQQKSVRDCTDDQRKGVATTIDLTDADDKDCRRKDTSKHSASETFHFVDANECRQIVDEERNVSADRLDDGKVQRATAASDESRNKSFEEDTLMNVTMHQVQLQIFEEDLFGIPATRNGAKATKVTSRGDPSREERGTPRKTKLTTKTALEEHSAEEDDIVENTPERKMKNKNNVQTAIKSRKNITALYSSPNRPADYTPSTSCKTDTPKSRVSSPMSRLEICPLYQSTPKVTPATTTITRPDAFVEVQRIEPTTTSGSVLSRRQANSRTTLENTDRQADGQKKLCFVCSGLTIAQTRHVKEFADRRNANYVTQFEPGVTHVIVNTTGKENMTKSTLKYLQGIAYRKWIVSYRWIEDCDAQRKLLDEVPYEATVYYDGVNGPGPRNSRLREKGLFEGFTFLCIGPYVNVTLSQYQDLLLATGATVVDSLEALAQKEGLRGIVIQDNTHDDKTIEHWYQTAKAAPIIVDWIVECIGQYKLSKLAPYISWLSSQDFCAIGYPRELVEDEEYSDDEI